MTLIACWAEQTTVRCLTDARLTFQKGTGIGANIGSKVAVIPVEVWASEGIGGAHKVALSHSFGYAFAGSSLIASTTYARASSMTQMLRADNEIELPSLKEVADLFAKVAEDHSRELRFTQPEADLATLLIFGYCKVTKAGKIFAISPEESKTDFCMRVDEVKDSAWIGGSGAPLFFKIAKELSDAGVIRSVSEIFVRALRSADALEHMVGGLPESVTAGVDGASIDKVLHFSGPDHAALQESVLGYPQNHSASSVGKLGIGFKAVEPDWAYRVGERILVDRGVSETDIAIRESLRDLALITYLIELNIRLGEKSRPQDKIHPGTYYLHAYKPQSGDSCFCGRCSNCGLDVPLFEDVSKGTVRHPLIGATLKSQCRTCGAPYETTSFLSFPTRWPKQVGAAIFNRAK